VGHIYGTKIVVVAVYLPGRYGPACPEIQRPKPIPLRQNSAEAVQRPKPIPLRKNSAEPVQRPKPLPLRKNSSEEVQRPAYTSSEEFFRRDSAP